VLNSKVRVFVECYLFVAILPLVCVTYDIAVVLENLDHRFAFIVSRNLRQPVATIARRVPPPLLRIIERPRLVPQVRVRLLDANLG